jgi:hypothetical protein
MNIGIRLSKAALAPALHGGGNGVKRNGGLIAHVNRIMSRSAAIVLAAAVLKKMQNASDRISNPHIGRQT